MQPTRLSPELPKTYDPHAVEAEAYRVWVDERCFSADPAAAGEPYAIVIPPPNVTAPLHLGHALNNTIQDILTRMHRMAGNNTVWLPGTDHAGIATQTVVEKRVMAEEGKRRTDFQRDEFVARIQAWKDEYEAKITAQLKAMGCSCDWDRQAFTMDEPRAKAVREAFFRLFKDGLIYRGKRLVNWDPVTLTALADDEVEMEEVDGSFFYLRYPLTDGTGFVTVATTRPETMLGDTAVALNPKDPRAAELKGKKLRLPIVGREIPIIEDEYVVMADPNSDDAKAKFASGFLKVTPAHDPNDYEIGRRHNLPVINVMAPDASISDKHGWTDVGDAGFVLGKSREAARKLIVDWFKREGLLEDVKPYRHSVGHSYRSHAPIEPYLSDQWYCKVTDARLAGAALEAMAHDQRDPGPATSKSGQSRDREGAVSEALGKPLPHGRGSSESTPTASSALGLFITFTTYGSWLHGKDRGSADRQNNIPGTPYLIGNEEREQYEFARLKHPPVSLDEIQRLVVRQTVVEVCRHRGWTLHVAHVRPAHVHIVLSGATTPERAMNDFKAYATRRLREAKLVGDEANVWTRHGSTRYLNTTEALAAAKDYVADRQGAPVPPGPIFGTDVDPHWEASGTSNFSVREGTSRDREGAVSEAPGKPLPDGRGSSERDPSDVQTGLRFYPARYSKTFQSWHENIRDWCISRQLWWGHRIPVWSHLGLRRGSAEFVQLRDWAEAGRIALQHGAVLEDESATSKGIVDGNLVTHFVCPQPDDGEVVSKLEAWGFTQDPDVLDTWFSSGLWPLSTLNWPNDTADLREWNPSSVLCTAREIITLWVSRMVMFNLYFRDCLPFKDVFIHAMIQDGEGQKMSKSLGNGVDPLDIIESHGADAMRYTLAAMTTHTQDLRMPVELVDPHSGVAFPPAKITNSAGYIVAAPVQVSPKDPKKKIVSSYGVISGQAKPTAEMPAAKNTSSKFDLGRNLCNKLWNAARFAISNLEAAPLEPADESKWSTADQWIVTRFNRTLTESNDALKAYRFDVYAKGCYDFFWRDLCDWYLEAIKPAMKDPARAGQTANVLASVLDGTLRLMHPVIPFITETIWWRLNQARPSRGLPGRLEALPSERLIQAAWPTVGSLSEAAEFIFPKLQEVIGAIRNLRNEYNVPPKQVVTVSIQAPGDSARSIIDNRELIELLATCTLKDVRGDLPIIANAARTQAAGCEVFVEGMVDESAEKQRVAKKCEDLKRQIAALRGRLSNEAYIAKAPPQLVQQTKDQLATAETEYKNLAPSE